MNTDTRRALGKGLSSLIPNNSYNRRDASEIDGEVLNVQIDKIYPNPNQPRKHFPKQEMNELSESIKEFGILQPIIVSISEDKYIIIAGERRWQASRQAGLTHIPVIIKSIDESRILKTSIIENIQRQDLSAIEEAKAYAQVMKDYNYTQEDLSKKLCKSRSHIANLLRLLHLPPEVQEMIEHRKISTGHAKVLLSSDSPLDTARYIIDNNLNVRQAEKHLKLSKEDKSVGESIKRVSHLSKLHADRKSDYSLTKDQDIIDIENNLTLTLGSKVEIVEKSFGGQVIIDFYNLDQLDAIISQLSTKKTWL